MNQESIKYLTIANNKLARQLAINSFSQTTGPLREALREVFVLVAKELRKDKLYETRTQSEANTYSSGCENINEE